MTVAIYFNHEGLFRTIEVYDVRTNAMLATELDLFQLPRS